MEKEIKKDTFKIDDKTLWIGGGILVTLLLTSAVIYYRKKKSKDASKTRSTSARASGFCKHGDSYPLKRGSCGKNVTALQNKLVALGFDIGDYGPKKNGVDGKYGEDTEKAVKKAIGRATIELADLKRLKNTKH